MGNEVSEKYQKPEDGPLLAAFQRRVEIFSSKVYSQSFGFAIVPNTVWSV